MRHSDSLSDPGPGIHFLGRVATLASPNDSRVPLAPPIGNPTRAQSRARANRIKEPQAMTAWPCIILAIDPGARSGWAICDGGHRVRSGQCRASKNKIVQQALRIARCSALPLVVAMEKWAGDFPTSATAIGLGAAAGGWLEACEANGVRKSMIVRVFPRTWQAATVGGKQYKRDAMNRRVKLWSRLHFALPEDPGADEAAALCIAAWASHAGELRKCIERKGKR